LTAGALSGAATGVIEAGQYALAPPETGQGIKAVPGKSSQLSKDSGFGEPGITEPSLLGDQTKVSGTGFTEKVPTGGGQGLTVNTRDFLPASLRRYDTDRSTVRGTEEGGLQPAYTSAADIFTPPSFDRTLTPDVGYKNQEQSQILLKSQFHQQQKLLPNQSFLVRCQSCLGLALKFQAHRLLVTLLGLLKLPQQALP
jgi:hypothetical protein